MQGNRAAFENTLGVQGLPCLHMPSQGKPCTPASLSIAPTATQAEKARLKPAPTSVESFVAQGADVIDMNVRGILSK